MISTSHHLLGNNWKLLSKSQWSFLLVAFFYFLGLPVSEVQAQVIPCTLDANIASTNATSCNASDGTATVTATVGAPVTILGIGRLRKEITYNWTTLETTSSITGLAPGTYGVEVREIGIPQIPNPLFPLTFIDVPFAPSINICNEILSVTVGADNALFVTVTSTDANCAGNESGTATATVTGATGALSYLWSNGETTLTAMNLHAGGYSVIVSDAGTGCTAVGATAIADPNGLSLDVTVLEPVSCNGGTDGTVKLALPFSPIAGTPPYTLTSIEKDFVSTGVSTAFNEGPINNVLTINNLSAGQYRFTVVDGNGCNVTATATIAQPTQIVADVVLTTDALCNGSFDGRATVLATGGTTPYTYAWSSGANTVTAEGLAADTYSVTVTDAKGCSVISSATIGQPDALSISVGTTLNVSCNGGSNGSIYINNPVGGTGPFNYNWASSGAFGFDQATDNAQDQVNNLPAGSYSVTITDANGCSSSINGINISEPSPLTVAITATTDADCAGNETGSATALATGGTGNITYTWSNGHTELVLPATPSTAMGLHAGGYMVVATDANGCTATAATDIADPNGLLFGVTASTEVSCFGGNDGTATLGIIGGTAPYEMFGYIGPDGTQVDLTAAPVPVVVGTVIPDLSAGLYAFFVRDANGCITANNINIHEPTLLIAEIIHQEDESCPDANDGTATVNATGGTTGYTYLWSASAGSQVTNIATALPDGIHSVTVTDAKGCTAEISVTIGTTDNVPPLFVTTIPGDITVECDAIPTPFVLIPAWHTTDNCSDAGNIIVDYTETIIDIVCPNTYTIKRKWLITDEAGNTAFHIRKVYVQDTTKPTFTVPADITIECDESTLPANTGDVTDQMDNCSAPNNVIVAYTDVEDYSGCGGYTGTITRTWTATDECMNIETKVQVITIEDTTAPVALCNSFEIFLDADGKASITVAQVDAGSTDNCAVFDSLVLSLDKMDFTCADIGNNTVTLSVEDPCGNIGTCEAIIKVTDAIDPIITCPANIVINLNPGECGRVIDYDVTATDNCEVIVSQIGDLTYTSGSEFPIGGPYVLDYKATDEGGNMVTCSFTVTVNEYVPTDGTIACNDLIQVSLDADCQAIVGADMILEGNNYGCYDDYIITIEDANGNILPSNILNIAHVNTTLTVTILDPDTGNSCWGEISVEDKLDPTFDCPADIDVTCNGATDPATTGEPVLTSCELSHTVTYEDDYVDFECTGSPMDPSVRARILRTWTITDNSGNTATCVQRIRIMKPDLANVIFPTNKDEINDNALDCGDVAANAGLTHPDYTGYPQFANQDVVPGGLCALSIGYDDITLEICTGGSSYEIIRTWTVRNMCEPLVPGLNPVQHIQSIKVLDTTGPALVCPPTQVLSPGANSCAVNVILPIAQVSDDCSGYDVWVETPFGTLNSNGGILPATFELGVHTVTYYAVDACGNTSSCDYSFTVEDSTPPTAICDEHTIASIGTDGFASISALTFDDGSYDNCSDLIYEVRKMTDACFNPPHLSFASAVEFCCAEIGTTVMVELRVTDAEGNSNSCMVEVEVQDKLAPTIICPANKTIDCDDDFADLDLTGSAIATDNCDDVTPIYIDNVSISDCGEGTVTRIWSVTDASGNSASCVQFIFLINSDPFNIVDTECRNYPINNLEPAVGPHSSKDDVEWPCDIELNTCGNGLTPDDLEVNYPLDARPQIFKGNCDLIAVTHEDETLPIQGDACLKILRTWIVIDWCNYDVNYPYAGGRWEYVQVIKVLNSEAPQVFPGGDSYIENFDAECGSTYVELFVDATDDCTPTEDLEITYAIENANGTVISTGSGLNASQAFANGDYKITWTVTDGCGNYHEAEHPFKVEDKKKPTPVCLNGLATVIMPSSGAITLWATDFESGSSFDNCTPYADLKFSFSSDITETNRTFTCSDISTSNTIVVEIWVTDNNGNQDFCETYILVQDPNSACPPGPSGTVTPLGTIMTEDGLEVEDVTVDLLGGTPYTVTTGANGAFNFPAVPTATYEIEAGKNVNPLNGVTTFDLVLISRHILGVETLNSPYKVIAADANGSESVTTFDIVTLRRLILQIDTEFTNNESWRFVDAAQTFANATNPFPFHEVIDFNATTANANFIGVKIGDVNGSASPNNLLGTDTRTFDGDLVFNVENKTVAAGETFTVDFNAKDFNNTLGYQFTLEFDNNKVTFEDVTTNLTDLSQSNFGLSLLEEGVITTSWNSDNANVEDNTTVFSLTFTATEAIEISDILNINSRYTTAEAYGGTPNDSDLYNVALAFNGQVATDKFELYQNTPNPFKEVTAIGFNLPEAATTTLKIFDVSGKVLRQVEIEGAQGFNEVTINRADLSGTGVLYYQVETANHTATMKMIIVD